MGWEPQTGSQTGSEAGSQDIGQEVRQEVGQEVRTSGRKSGWTDGLTCWWKQQTGPLNKHWTGLTAAGSEGASLKRLLIDPDDQLLMSYWSALILTDWSTNIWFLFPLLLFWRTGSSLRVWRRSDWSIRTSCWSGCLINNPQTVCGLVRDVSSGASSLDVQYDANCVTPQAPPPTCGCGLSRWRQQVCSGARCKPEQGLCGVDVLINMFYY